jgi:peptide/nickel transport system permease protein
VAVSADTPIGAVPEYKEHSLFVNVMIRLVKEKPLGLLGAVIVLALLFVGIFADVLAPHGVNDLNISHRLLPPSRDFILGTDDLGRDLLSRIIYGARTSMIIGLCASSLSVSIGIVLGILSGFWGGKWDLAIQRFVDAWMSLPWLFVVLSAMVLLSGGMIPVIIILGLHRGITNSRVIRSAVMGVKENTYVLAAKAIGCSVRSILTRHILPNIMAPIIIMFTLSMGEMILSEATLSFLGFGVPPPAPSWGNMLSGDASKYMYTAPWLAIWPGLALSIVIFGINMLGDALRDILDPRLKGGLGRYGGAKLKKMMKIKRELK